MSNTQENFHDFFKRLKNPINYGEIDGANAVSEESDYSCGDRVKIFLKIKGGRIVDAKFTSEACLFCNASASMLTELVKGKTVEEALRMGEEELLGFFKADSKSPRYRCITLPLRGLRKTLQTFKPE